MMDEWEWEKSEHPQRMLTTVSPEVLSGKPIHFKGITRASVRKLLLFSVACGLRCEKHTIGLENISKEKEGSLKDSLAWAMWWADPLAPTWEIPNRPTQRDKADILRCIMGNAFRPVTLLCRACDGTGEWDHSGFFDLSPEEIEQYGRPKSKCPNCKGTGLNDQTRALLTSLVVSLAEQAYNDTLSSGMLDPFLLSLLADSLEDAGCIGTQGKCNFCDGKGTTLGAGPDRGNPDCDHCEGTGKVHYPDELVAHLRSDKPHYRGCYVLDLLLGKE